MVRVGEEEPDDILLDDPVDVGFGGRPADEMAEVAQTLVDAEADDPERGLP